MDKLKHIMIVEDDEDIREILSLVLSEIGGFKLTICGSGQEALESIVTHKPQLILLDVMMPKIDGITTFKNLRKNPKAKDIPVIFMTARIQPHEMEEYSKLGCIGIISKPFDPRTLSSDVIKMWLEFAKNTMPVESIDPKFKTKNSGNLSILYRNYAKDLPGKISLISQQWEIIRSQPWETQSWNSFYLIVHSLASSSGAYGFYNLHETLLQLESTLKLYLNKMPIREDFQKISRLMVNVKSSLEIQPLVPEQFLPPNDELESQKLKKHK